MPTNIVYGRNSFDKIPEYIKDRKVLLITSNGFINRGGLNRLRSMTNTIVDAYSEIQPLPDFNSLKNIHNIISNKNYDLILAIGGGSVIDSAKFLSVKTKNNEYEFIKNITQGLSPKQSYTLTPIIAVPTTAGTSSEITPWATIWDTDTKKKHSLHLSNLFPETAIYDPELTLTLPKEITIQTALDALSHALESIWNKNSNPITIDYAIKSAKIIIINIVQLVNDLNNLQYRDAILKGCMYAGLAFSNTQTSIAHAISYYLTANKGIPHGIACSFSLPMIIDNVIGRSQFIDDALIQIFGELSSEKLYNIYTTLNISTKITDYGINNSELTKLKLSLKNNQRANNSIITIDDLNIKG